MTIAQALSQHPDAALLLGFVLKKDKAYLFANPEKNLSRLQATSYKLLITKRNRGVPAAYLLGHKEFYGLDFLVNKHTLIPRPETELLVEKALKTLNSSPLRGEARWGWNIIDVGTGSGCIIISLAKHLSHATFFATDISPRALSVARNNARRLGVAKKIKFLRGNLLDPLSGHCSLDIGHSLILANLPYLSPSQLLSNPDLSHEPRSALLAGGGGLKYYKKLFSQIPSSPGEGRMPERQERLLTILLEHDPSQISKLRSLAHHHFPKAKPTFHRDLARRFRVMEISI